MFTVMLVPVIQVLAAYLCFSKAAQRSIWQLEDATAEWFESLMASLDDSDIDDFDPYALPQDVYDGLLEYGLDPNEFYIDPSKPNEIQRKQFV